MATGAQPSGHADFDAYASRLLDPNKDVESKLKTIGQLREVIESTKDTDYERLLQKLLPAFCKLLDPAQVTFVKESPEQQLRCAALDLLHRLPHNEAFAVYAKEVMALLIQLLRVDNEDIGASCIKIVIDLTRMYKSLVEVNMKQFLQVVHEMYCNGATIVDEIFGDSNVPPPHFPRDDPKAIPASIYSFKVLVECPIAVVIVFQTSFKTGLNDVARNYLPDVVNFMSVQAAAQRHAHEEAALRGQPQLGMSTDIKYKSIYLDFVNAQIKSVSLLAYVIRSGVEELKRYETEIPEICVRLLQDIPRESASANLRRELLVAVRHIFNTDFKVHFKSQMDAFLDERIIVGPGATAVQYLRPLGYSMLADLVHNVRNDLTINQIEKVVLTYTVILQNPALTPDVITVCAKLLCNLVEPLIRCGDKQKAGMLLVRLLESCVQKLKGLNGVRVDMADDPDSSKELSMIAVEKEKPFAGAGYVSLPPAEAKKDVRYLVRLLMHGLRAVISGIRVLEVPAINADILGPFFEGFILCMGFFSADRAESREEKEILEWLAGMFFDMDPHVVQEIWTMHMDFFFQQARTDATLLALLYKLLYTDRISHQMVSILLRYLVDRYDTLGEQDRTSAAVTLKLFKACYQAVAQYPAVNEKVLLPHLAKLILDSFPLAAKAPDPMNYFMNLRNLFRAIGGGRFELLYSEVLPILQEMLESFNQFIDFVDPAQHDLIVELALTVPVRLTHLLPHLGLLVKPLIAGLHAGPEIVAQALRTLELCVDNLTAEFLEPIIRPSHCELMSAIHMHLRPHPYDIKLSHVCARILGKLGGRNRRLNELRRPLEYRSAGEDATLLLSFDGQQKHLDIGPVIELAAKSVRHSNSLYSQQAFEFLKQAVTGLLRKGVTSSEQITRYEQAMGGLFAAIRVAELRPAADSFLLDMFKHIYEEESRKKTPNPGSSRRMWGPVIGGYLDATAQSIACAPSEERDELLNFVKKLVDDLGIWKKAEAPAGPYNPGETMAFIIQLATRFVGLCYHSKWFSKFAGFTGLTLLTSNDLLGVEWVQERQLDLIQALLSVLRETPYGAPQYVQKIVESILFVARTGHVKGMAAKQKQNYVLGGVMLRELCSSITEVRRAAQSVLQIYAELDEVTVSDLIRPFRDRLLTSVYQKPLRALPFAVQIGHIDAMTYCLHLEPPLIDVNDELWRLLGESLALADAEDSQLLGKTPQRKHIVLVSQLRVACIRLLTSSMNVTDFMAKQPQTRQRATALYFKSLYSASQDVKTAAYDGLRLVLEHQNKLPRETLQAGLKPILMNLADARRLTVPNLEGLARLLELLTNYFKVEIGLKLIDHFKVLAEPHMLQESAFFPLADNEEIKKLVRLVNVFHLLPQAANTFLVQVVPLVVNAETALRAAGPTPFTEPLAKYFERFPEESFQLLLREIQDPSYVRTLRSCLNSGFAPSLCKFINSHMQDIIDRCFGQPEGLGLVIPGILICKDMLSRLPNWLVSHPGLFQRLREMWHSLTLDEDDSFALWPYTRAHQATIMSDIFMECLQQQPSAMTLLDLSLIFTRKSAVDFSAYARFIYEFLISHTATTFRAEILMQGLTILEDTTLSAEHKTCFLRYVVNPMLYIALHQPAQTEFVNADFINLVHAKVWKPYGSSEPPPALLSESPLMIELLQLSTHVIRIAPNSVHDARKDLIKCGWAFSTSDDILHRQTAYVLLAQFLDLFESPAKIVIRVWAGLIRTHSAEGRALTRKALDILAPALPKRVPKDDGDSPSWAKNTRRLLLEESSSMSQLTTVYQLILRHAELFFPSRELFVTNMVNSLFKLGIGQTATGETRLLSVDIAELLIRWEREAIVEPPIESTPTRSATESSSARPAAESTPARVATGSSGIWKMSVLHKETIVSFLVRYICNHVEPISVGGLVGRAYGLLTEVLDSSQWQDVNVVLPAFHRNLVQTDYSTETATTFRNNAVVLAAVANRKRDEWFRQHSAMLLELLKKAIRSDDTILHESLGDVVNRMFDVLPEPSEEEGGSSEDTSWCNWANETISAGITTVGGLQGALFLLQAWVRVRPEKVDAFSAALAQIMGKLARAHVTKEVSSPQSADIRPICVILQLFSNRIAYLPEPRRLLFNVLNGLVEKSQSVPICRSILEVVRKWVFDRNDGSPPLRDVAILLLNMVRLESKGDDSLTMDYFSLIHDIYSDPKLHRTELTVRLEAPFFTGTRLKDPILRSKFMELLDNSLPRSLPHRLQYILASVCWDHIGEYYWLHQALDLVLGSADEEQDGMDVDDQRGEFASLMSRDGQGSVLSVSRRLIWLDDRTTHGLWVSSFRYFWACLSRRAQSDMLPLLVTQLGQQYHRKQVSRQLNVIQTLLGGIAACTPALTLPPHLTKYLGKTFRAWHDAIEQLQSSLGLVKDDDGFQENTLDSLAEMYAELAEEDMFYGVWRRRALHWETNVAMSFEQNGFWKEAITIYENAQLRAKSASLPSAEAEHSLWEDHWLLGSQKLAQWDILLDYSRAVSDPDLLLECAWRTQDWTTDREHIERALEATSDNPSPRRSGFEAYLAILKMYLMGAGDKDNFSILIDRAVQLALQKWSALPEAVTVAHVPLLHHYQQLVELQESQQIFNSLANTQAANLEKKSGELKVILQGWRERLPNPWDDIQIWSDLVAWRQHIFGVINKAYLPLIPQVPGAGAATANTNTFGYRGYHEMAWIINRFAHVARKHELWEVCHTSLTKIYTLPNIEISEAFLKLREQAKCHLQRRELSSGLEVINNTNLIFFSSPQKAEFFTMKGMFIAAAGGMEDEAYAAYSQAVKTDLNLPKAWAEWGRFCDRLYRVKGDVQLGAHAVTCYLQASMLFKSHKARPLLARVLWLLRADDDSGKIHAAFDGHRGDYGFWWWIHLIPQLLSSLNHRESRQARNILIQLAKFYPQALFFQLRTMRDEEAIMRRQREQRELQIQASRKAAMANQHTSAVAKEPLSSDPGSSSQAGPNTAVNGNSVKEEPNGTSLDALSGNAGSAQLHPANPNARPGAPEQPVKDKEEERQHPVDEITSILKTAFPLLALTMEAMADQFMKSFKNAPEEDLLRYLNHLTTDGLTSWAARATHIQPGGDPVRAETIQRIVQFAPSLPEGVRVDFKADFVDTKPSMREYIARLLQWRDKYDRLLESRPKKGALDVLSHHLAEFHHLKFDDIEVPGQYLKFENTNLYFVKIQRFKSFYEMARTSAGAYKCITMIGNNGTEYGFMVQTHAGRSHRREEKLTQLFRILSRIVESRKEAQKRGIFFQLPGYIPVASSCRLVEHSASVISFQDISDEYMAKKGWTKEHAILSFSDKMREHCLALIRNGEGIPDRNHVGALRLNVYDEIQTKLVPDNVMHNYFIRTYPQKKDLWLMRKQFTLHLAATYYLTHVFALSNRLAGRYYVERSTGNVYLTDALPAFGPQGPKTGEPTPFRLTPNIQRFVTREGIEGIIPSALLAIARSLCQPEFDMDSTILLYIRDEVMAYIQQSPKQQQFIDANTFNAYMTESVKLITERADLLSCKMERNKGAASTVPVFQTIIDIIGQATNPLELAKMSEISMPWF